MTGPVHFIHLGGELRPQHWRAVKTAAVHERPIWFWTVRDVVSEMPGVEIRHLHVRKWLRDHPIKLANVKDYYAYTLLRTFGGMYLDLDTISLRPAWDLLPKGKDLCVSTEYHPDDPHPNRNNSAVMIARQNADVLHSLEADAIGLLRKGEDVWGAIGPHLVSGYAMLHPDVIEQAPYRALNGWSYHTIQDYYDDPRDPGEPVRVIHLYSSSYLTQFENDQWMPTT